jgi:hypothetical protein
MLLPVAVLLMGSNRFLSALILGNILDYVLEGPIVVRLLPWMQEQALVKYPHHKQCVNDMTASIYNTSLGRLVGYSIGPLLASEGFDRTTLKERHKLRASLIIIVNGLESLSMLVKRYIL